MRICETSPVVGSSPPHQHDGFLPDFLGLDGLLVLPTGRSAAGGKAIWKCRWHERPEPKISLYLFKNLICGPREPRMWRPTAERMRLDCWPESQLCSAGMKGRIHLHSRWLPVLPQINMDPLPPRTLPSPLHLRGLLHSPPPPPSPPVIRVIQT